MKLAMIRTAAGRDHLAAVVDDRVVDLTEAAGGAAWAESLLSLIKHGPEGLAAARTLLSQLNPAFGRPVAETRFAPPIARPPKNVLCLGKNYPEHITEVAQAWGDPTERPKAPIIFTKPPTAICGARDPIRHPANTQQLDYEGELAVIIGKGGRGVPAERVGEHIFGYMLLNDVTARDLQRLGPQWFIGKGCDTFCPTGPWVVLADPEQPQPEVEIRVSVNGVERQRFNTRHMIFSIPETIAFLSQNITLEPGDIIATGTGPGCGFALDPPGFLQVGDTVVVEAAGYGRLENRVVAAESR